MDELIAALENYLRVAKAARQVMRDQPQGLDGIRLLRREVDSLVRASTALRDVHITVAASELRAALGQANPCTNGRN